MRAILEHIGEPATPPRIASARGPPQWYDEALIIVQSAWVRGRLARLAGRRLAFPGIAGLDQTMTDALAPISPLAHLHTTAILVEICVRMGTSPLINA